MAEAESLLNVSATASYDRMRNAAVARSLLQTLHTETSVFNSKEPPPERYLFILVSISNYKYEENIRTSVYCSINAVHFYLKPGGLSINEDVVLILSNI